MSYTAFAEWIESHPTQGMTFHEWCQTFWPKYKRHCMDIARNVYIMQEAVRAFELRLGRDMTWKQAMNNSHLLTDLEEICACAQIRSSEYFSNTAQTLFESKCRKIYDNNNRYR